MAEPQINESGNTYGKLTVTDKWESKKYSRANYIRWWCICECGKEKWVVGSYLRAGRIKSCGCNRRNNPNWGQHKIEKDSKYFFQNWLNIWRQKSGTKEFTLTLNEMDALYEKQDGKCYYTGEKLVVANGSRYCVKETNISIDRIDNDRGYTIDNIVLCLKMVNIARNTYTQQEFITMCRCVANNSTLTQESLESLPDFNRNRPKRKPQES